MQHKKIFLALLIVDIMLLTVYELSKRALSILHLAYRNTVNYSVYAVLTVVTLIICIQMILFLFRQARQKQREMAIRFLSVIGIAVIVIVLAFASLSGFIHGVFGHHPEHVVEKDGKVLLARVDSFLQVEVRYYDHVNAFVRGSQIRIEEDYGNGGYDPFEREELPEVQRYTYYDEEGEMIKSNWFDNYGTTSSTSDDLIESDTSK